MKNTHVVINPQKHQSFNLKSQRYSKSQQEIEHTHTQSTGRVRLTETNGQQRGDTHRKSRGKKGFEARFGFCLLRQQDNPGAIVARRQWWARYRPRWVTRAIRSARRRQKHRKWETKRRILALNFANTTTHNATQASTQFHKQLERDRKGLMRLVDAVGLMTDKLKAASYYHNLLLYNLGFCMYSIEVENFPQDSKGLLLD